MWTYMEVSTELANKFIWVLNLIELLVNPIFEHLLKNLVAKKFTDFLNTESLGFMLKEEILYICIYI